jgi:hypothetical protein
VLSELVSQHIPALQSLKMLFIRHFSTFIFASVFGSMTLAMFQAEDHDQARKPGRIEVGKIYEGCQSETLPKVSVVHVFSVILENWD